MATAYEGSAPAVSQRRLAPRRCVLRIGVGLLVIVAGIWLLRWSGIGIGLPTQVEDLAWRPGSTTLAAFYWRSRDVYIPFPFGEGFRTENSDQQLAIWDTAQPRTRPRLLKLADEQPGDLTYSPDGQWLAYGRYYVYGTGAGAVQIWPATDMSAAPQTLPIPKGATVLRLRYRPDSRELAVQLRLGSDDDVVYLFDPAAPQTSPENQPRG